MKRVPVSAALSLFGACVVAVALSPGGREQTCCGDGWLASALAELESAKAGMTRGELLKVFERQGGLRTRTRERFVYRKCDLIQVDVEFDPVGAGSQESSEDKVKSISEPVLARMRAD